MTYPSRRSGFTVVELLVALSLFSIVTAVATGAFIRALRTQRQLVAFAAANSNVSLVLEQMAREIRVGSDFQSPNMSELHLTNARGEHVTYEFEEGELGGRIERTVEGTSGQGTQQLTAENVNIRYLEFRLSTADPEDGYPARVVIAIAVSPLEQGLGTSVVRIQTTVSARSLGT